MVDIALSLLKEIHGIHHLQCLAPCKAAVWRADDFIPELDNDYCRLLNEPPRCPPCGGMARPNILMFGDDSWLSGRRELQRRLQETWLDQVAVGKGKIVIVEMGAGTAIPSVRNFSHHISRDYGARIVRINPRERQVPSSRDVGIAAGSLEALVAIDAVLKGAV